MKKIKLLTAVLVTLLTVMAVVSLYGGDYPYYIKVNRTTNCVTVYQKDSTGNYTVPVKAMICSVGAGNNTPVGKFKTPAKYRWKELIGGVWGQYSTRITDGVLFHSCCYATTNGSTLFTKTYNKLGKKDSLGCVRLTVADAKWIYDNCPLGTTVEVFDAPTDPLPRPEAIKMTANTNYPNWDPTDPDPNNPWRKEQVKIIIDQPKKFIKRGDAYAYNNLSEILHRGVKAYDAANNEIHYDISCDVNVNECGQYIIKYYAADCLGNYNENLGIVMVVN